MNLTPKDQLGLTVLLPVLIAATYVVFWSRPVLKEKVRLDEDLRALGDESALLLRRDQLNAEQTRLQQALFAAETAAAVSVAPPPAGGEHPAASLRRLQETFHRSGLRLLSVTVGASPADGGVAEALRKTGAPQPKTWHVTAEATYAALLRLLDACETNRFPVVPVTLSMRPGAGESKNSYWTLSVCL